MQTGRRNLMAGLAASALAGRARATAPLDGLRSRLKGRLILPGDAVYDSARRGASFSPAEDRRPAAIVQCADASDVARAIDFARSASLAIAVKAGGHDVLGECVNDGGVVIDLGPMTGIDIDAANRTAVVQAGVRSGAFTAAAKPHGLAPVLGCNPAVGVAGLTLGGGLGWFLGTHGAACDNLIGADLVTADGRRLRLSERENPDLFWGVRGGGGNFGVVTSLRYRLQPITTVLAGVLGFRGDPAPFLRFYRDFMAAAPDALAVELSISAGRAPTILAICCWSGSLEEGQRILAPLRSFDKPTLERIGPMAYGDFAGRAGGGGAAGNLFWRGGSLDRLNDAAIGRLAEIAQAGPPNLSIGLGHYMHGQICAVPSGATPLVRRPGQLSYFIGTGWDAPAQAPASIEAVTSAMATLRPVSAQATYVNYLSSDAEDAVRAAYGEANYARLQRLKTRYDPGNLFHFNRNIRPTIRRA
jgi:FAD/FMN-containing dehydrogenase